MRSELHDTLVKEGGKSFVARTDAPPFSTRTSSVIPEDIVSEKEATSPIKEDGHAQEDVTGLDPADPADARERP